ncbi:phage tail fiber protein [Rhizobium rhizogenes]|uniref:phage tail fiber protein n=1 Tax=Rhizobium rhizogenes TaxID=359 RepID=UPI0004D3C23B|nr:hypothetical protein [Rhizobium rhizogenes]KEA07119.1 hypothetical protein CN09_09170 [Rhizobium rhizogenes]NTI80458.1 hypothetical protein [Rhizobium rhizogenes]NTJ22644.1 hypothetical protein [Rhizobium rhizogenes]QUE81347.1 hypothetical protein EML492_05945 [Rhizobium rhizogenes]TQO80557.1 hypothetical protein FFE80_05495 [Rhizobium rhizogenes]
MASITSANAIITLTIPGLFNTPQQLQGFSADNIYDMAVQEVVQTAMGVDGILSGGFVFNPVEQTFDLQADSNSNTIFETWAATQKQIKDVLIANGETTLTSVGRSYVLTKGFLISLPPAPAAGRILQARRYMVRWESCFAVPA